MEINKKFIFAFLTILLLGIVSSSNISVSYPEEVEVGEEFKFALQLFEFSEDVYDVKIDILCNEVRISRILNGEVWKSTNYYVNEIIKNNEEKEFELKTEKICDRADIEIKIRNSKDKIETFLGYEIKSVEPEKSESENSDEEEEENEEDSEEDEEEKETETENSEKIEYSDDKVAETINLKPIVLNTQNIKSENDKEFSVKDLAFYGVIFFGVVFGALFFLNKRKYKNEFQ